MCVRGLLFVHSSIYGSQIITGLVPLAGMRKRTGKDEHRTWRERSEEKETERKKTETEMTGKREVCTRKFKKALT